MNIVLPLTKTELHQQLEVLLKRYRRRDRIYEEIQDAYGKERAGYQGEMQLDYFLHLADLQKTFSLAGPRLKWDKHYFQIDRMILTSSVCFIIESKNFKGELTLNEEDQLIQQTPDYQKGYDNPYTQVKLQAKQLRQVLNSLGYSDLPIHPLVVFTNKNAILNLGGNADMITLQQLTFRIDSLCQHYQAIYTTPELKKLAYLLLNKHTLKQENIINRFKVDLRSIQAGVLCTKCEYGIMKRIHGNWSCQKCQHQDRHAHIEALSDYARLFNPLITNKTARRFLQVDSPDIIYRLLSGLELLTKGNNRSTQYNLEKLLEKNK
ncbi:nuclease-related domain-containing protein [Amphibacillus indicireducens]|uniref:NERD domain-containing protein n=1 Tax=Amphibacillus indicireducens TaxID=1076330 RepID=A0ABP7VAM0_9BACI